MANEALWDELLKFDAQDTANRAKCNYCAQRHAYSVTMLGREYLVDLRARQIHSGPIDSPDQRVGFLEELCLLAYLAHAQAQPLAGKAVKPQALPSGEFFFRGLHKVPLDRLQDAFGHQPERLCQAGERLGAKELQHGDASIELQALPRIPVTVIIWAGDEQFGPRASVLVDQTAACQLPLDALGTLLNLVVKRLTEIVDTDA